MKLRKLWWLLPLCLLPGGLLMTAVLWAVRYDDESAPDFRAGNKVCRECERRKQPI